MGLFYDLNLKHSWGASKEIGISYNMVGVLSRLEMRLSLSRRVLSASLFGLELRLVGRFFQTLCRTLSSLIFLVFRVRFRLVLSLSGAGHPWYRPFLDLFYRRDVNSEPQRNPPMRYYESIGENRNPEDIRFSAEYPRQSSADKNVLNKDPYDEENIEGNGSG